MKNEKSYKIGLFVAACILINLAGKAIASNLPLWLDSLGTVLAAYVLGPFCGGVVGASTNIIDSFTNSLTYVYSLTSIAIGVITGYFARRKMFESIFGVLSAAFLIAVVSTAISVPFNCLFYSGYTGNAWGDGTIDMLQSFTVSPIMSYIAGQFYMDFPDKVLTFMIFAGIVKLYRKKRELFVKHSRSANMLLVGLLLVGMLAPANCARASETYDGWLQTIYSGENGLPSTAANDIAATKDGVLWIGTYGGLYRYNGTKFEWMDKFDSVKNVNCFYADDEGRLWIGTNDSGLSILINGAVSNVIDKSEGLPSDSVRCIAKGSGARYYVGTTDSLAVVTLSSGLSVTQTIDEIKYANSISVSDDKQITAVVTNEGDLYLLEQDTVLSKKVCQTEGAEYTCCAFGSDGMLYVGTSWNKIEVYKMHRYIHRSSSSRAGEIDCGDIAYIKSINPFDNGNMIVCADNGAGRIDSEKVFYKINTGKYDNSIEHMVLDFQGNLWFTSSRLGLLKLSKSTFSDAFMEAGLNEYVVNSVAKHGNYMYFGTDTGLVVINAVSGNRVENALTEVLNGVRVRSVYEDSEKDIWVSTSSLGVVEQFAEGGLNFYDISKGLLGNRFRCALELSDGTMALAGDSGITFLENGEVTCTLGGEALANPKTLCLYEAKDGSLLAGSDGGGISVIKNRHVERTVDRDDGLSSEVVMRIVADGDEGCFIVTGNGLCYMDNDGKVGLLENFPYYNNYDVIVGSDGELYVPGSAGLYVIDRDTLLSGEKLDVTPLGTADGLAGSFTPNSWSCFDGDYLYIPCNEGAARLNLREYSALYRPRRLQLREVICDGVSIAVQADDTIQIPSGTGYIELCPEVINYSSDNPYVSVYLEGFDSAPNVIRLSELTNIVYKNLPAGEYTFRLAALDAKQIAVAEISYRVIKEKELYEHKWFSLYFLFVGTLSVAYFTWMLFRTQVQRTLKIQKRELEIAKQQVEMGNEAIMTIAKTVDARDINTSRHSERVSEYSVMIAKKLGFTDEACEELRRTALLHDIGKIGIPDSILNKPSRLTDEEYDIMKSHVVKGAEILKNFTAVDNIVVGALYHHERYDGKGYVHGLKGKEIPLNARIIGIADAFDAMTANRVYRNKLDMDFVMGELEKGKGKQFDPEIADVMLDLIRSGAIDIERLYGTGDKK